MQHFHLLPCPCHARHTNHRASLPAPTCCCTIQLSHPPAPAPIHSYLQGSWTVASDNLSGVTDPPLANVSTATFAVPFKSSTPACPSTATFATEATERYLQFKARSRRVDVGAGCWAAWI